MPKAKLAAAPAVDDGALAPLPPGHFAYVAPTPEPAAGSAGLLHRQIRPDPANPRKDFDAQGLKELQASIVADGLLENLVVRPLKGVTTSEGLAAYMLIAGERRWQAIGLAIKAKAWGADRPIDCSVKDVDEPTARRLALVENLQRRDLKPVEEARALEALIELTGTTAAQCGRDLGFTERWAQQRIALLKLPAKMQTRIDAGTLKVEDARDAGALLPKLPEIQQVALIEGKLTVAAAKAWLAEQPEPLSDRAQLALLEFLEKAAAEPFKPYEHATERGCEITAETVRTEIPNSHTNVRVKVCDKSIDELAKRYIFDSPREITIESVEVGRHYLQTRYYCDQAIKVAIPQALDAKKRPGLIAALRAKLNVGEIPAGRYATPWLNVEPVELSPALAAEIEAKAKARKARQAEHAAAQKVEDERRSAEQAVRRERLAAIKAAEPQLLTGEDPIGAARDLAVSIERPLPWHLDEQSGIVTAADGAIVLERPWNYGDQQRLQARLVVTLANAAGGLASPDRKPRALDPDALSRDGFLREVVLCLIDDCDDLPEGEVAAAVEAEQRAERGLEAFLAQEQIRYGDAEYDWQEFGAQQLAQLIDVDGLGRQVDLEDAIAAAAPVDPEPSPALLALAGAGPAREIAA